MKSKIIFVTGTDTGVGKTVFTSLLTQYLRKRGVNVAALKPISSGGRDDARILRDAGEDVLSLDDVNPWHFRAPVAPLLAGRKENRRVRLSDVANHVQRIKKKFEMIVVEGAGGLLSPLGEGFDSRVLVRALRATPIIVCPNRLGAVNQVLLVLEALPRNLTRCAHVVLMATTRPDSSSRTNPGLLRKLISPVPVHVLPRMRLIGDMRKDQEIFETMRVLTNALSCRVHA